MTTNNLRLEQRREQIIQAAQGPAKGVDGRYRFLSQVGIRFGKEGELQFDEAKFNTAYDTDPEAVRYTAISLADKADSTVLAMPVAANCLGETLTATETSAGQMLA